MIFFTKISDLIQFCGEPGLCAAVVVHREYAGSVAMCQGPCTNFDGCDHYSYNPGTAECFMFDVYPKVDDTLCPDCVSGSPGCEIEDEGNSIIPEIG